MYQSLAPEQLATWKIWTDLRRRLDADRLLPLRPLLGRRLAHDAVDDREVRLAPGDPLHPLARPGNIGRSDI